MEGQQAHAVLGTRASVAAAKKSQEGAAECACASSAAAAGGIATIVLRCSGRRQRLGRQGSKALRHGRQLRLQLSCGAAAALGQRQHLVQRLQLRNHRVAPKRPGLQLRAGQTSRGQGGSWWSYGASLGPPLLGQRAGTCMPTGASPHGPAGTPQRAMGCSSVMPSVQDALEASLALAQGSTWRQMAAQRRGRGAAAPGVHSSALLTCLLRWSSMANMCSDWETGVPSRRSTERAVYCTTAA